MNIKTKIAIQLVGLLILGFLFGAILFVPSVGNTVSNAGSPPRSVGFEASYEDLVLDGRISRADSIFVGQVAAITPARFNQDNGEYWQQDAYTAMPYHTLEVTVVRSLADKLNLGNKITITVLGGSTAGSIQSGDVKVGLTSEHTLRVGDRAVFFVWRRNLAWRGTDTPLTTRPVNMLMGGA